MKIVWRVSEPPSGRYRSFHKRGWPTATMNHRDGETLATLYCDTEYVPNRVKAGDHDEITIKVADHRLREPGKSKWVWRTLKRRATTLTEAKQLVADFYERRSEWLPGNS